MGCDQRLYECVCIDRSARRDLYITQGQAAEAKAKRSLLLTNARADDGAA